MRFVVFFSIFITLTSCFVFGQIPKTDKELILQMCLNDAKFPQFYNYPRVYILENELISRNAKLKLRWNNKKVKIISEKDTAFVPNYIGIGDFTIIYKYNHGRIMLSNVKDKTMFNISYEKTDGVWKISDSVIMDE